MFSDFFKEIFGIGLFLGSTFLMAWSLHHLIIPLKKHKVERVWGMIVAFVSGVFGLLAVSYLWLCKLFTA